MSNSQRPTVKRRMPQIDGAYPQPKSRGIVPVPRIIKADATGPTSVWEAKVDDTNNIQPVREYWPQFSNRMQKCTILSMYFSGHSIIPCEPSNISRGAGLSAAAALGSGVFADRASPTVAQNSVHSETLVIVDTSNRLQIDSVSSTVPHYLRPLYESLLTSLFVTRNLRLQNKSFSRRPTLPLIRSCESICHYRLNLW